MKQNSLHDQIVEHFEGKAGLARTLGISKQAVSDWRGAIPEGRAYQIEVISKGRFKASDILREAKGGRKAS